MSKNNTKLVVGMTVALIATAAVSSITTLSVTSSASNNTDLVTMKGDTLTVSEFYEDIKEDSSVQNLALQSVLSTVLEKNYGKKVSAEDVQKAYDKEAKAYGDSFSQALAYQGQTEESFRDSIRTQKLMEYAVNKAAEKKLTDKRYQAAYDKYTPEVSAQIIKLDEEAKANEVLEKAKAAGADFAQLAKDNSTDAASKSKGGEVKFDSTSTTYPNEVMEAVFALKEGQVGDKVVSVVDQNSSTSFYVVKLNKKTQKSKNWKDYKEQLRQWIINQQKSDSAFLQSVIQSELNNANVKVKDQALQSIFSQYMTTGSSGSASASSSSDTSEKSSDKASSSESSSSKTSSSSAE